MSPWSGPTTSLLIGLAMLLAAPGMVRAQPSAALTGVIDETFSRDVKTNTHQSVVGLMVGPKDATAEPGGIDIDHLGAMLPSASAPSSASRRACFSATTSDGVYLASGNLHSTSNEAGFLPIKPPGEWQYRKQLANYPVRQFGGLLIGDMRDCQGRRPGTAVLYPLSLGGNAEVLRVAVAGRGAHVGARPMR